RDSLCSSESAAHLCGHICPMVGPRECDLHFRCGGARRAISAGFRKGIQTKYNPFIRLRHMGGLKSLQRLLVAALKRTNWLVAHHPDTWILSLIQTPRLNLINSGQTRRHHCHHLVSKRSESKLLPSMTFASSKASPELMF